MANSEKTNWQPGDLVALASGSPTMTVQWVTEETVGCAWFWQGEPKFAEFKAAALKASRKTEKTSLEEKRRGR